MPKPPPGAPTRHASRAQPQVGPGAPPGGRLVQGARPAGVRRIPVTGRPAHARDCLRAEAGLSRAEPAFPSLRAWCPPRSALGGGAQLSCCPQRPKPSRHRAGGRQAGGCKWGWWLSSGCDLWLLSLFSNGTASPWPCIPASVSSRKPVRTSCALGSLVMGPSPRGEGWRPSQCRPGCPPHPHLQDQLFLPENPV